MAVQTVFKRYEIKYSLTKEQYSNLLICMNDHMQQDEYGRHKISNIYFDTEDYKVIRNSLEKPNYKEKLRLRIYGEPKSDGLAFIELKKKFNGVVYKRRMTAPQREALSYLCDETKLSNKTQIQKEIDYFKQNYDNLVPRIFLSYEREAYYCLEDENFRMTFDFNIKMRDVNVSLKSSSKDKKVVDDERVLLEVKTAQGLPFWFLDFLRENEVFKMSFSKYGTAYKTYLLPAFLQNLRSTSNE